ncbi:sensor histidine kinase [Isoptericola sp. NPDC058082]|uniref:sensor histidine kinase n=1 Tax=Isoptericola sp. NPDC058082 TaxID=3346331 RepID=UPI0036E1887D
MTSTSPAAPSAEPAGGAAFDPAQGGAPGGPPWARRRIGLLVSVVWVVFLAEPFRAALDADTVALRVAGVLGVLGVGAIFAGTVLTLQRRGRVPRRAAVVLIVVQAVCVALSCLAAQEHGLVGLVFVCVTAIYSLGGRAALWVVVTSIVVMLVLPRVLPGWATEDGNALAVVLASAAVYGFMQVIDRNRRLIAARQELADLAVARERERIARDMHDVLGHSLTVISVKAELAAKLLRAGAPDRPDAAPEARAAHEVADIQDLARGALADVRGMVAGSRRVTLAGELAATRSALDAAGVAADLPGAVDVVPADRRELFAWVLREGTTNVLRHAGASRVVVTVTADSLVVEDDGRGRPATREGTRDEGGGHGLTGLAARARQAGAVLETGPGPLGGFRLAVTVRDGAPAGARIDP